MIAFTEEWMMRIFGSWEAYKKSQPNRIWYPSPGGWASVDRGTGYIEPGTAARRAEEAKNGKA